MILFLIFSYIPHSNFIGHRLYNPIEFVNNMIRNRLYTNKFETVNDLHKILQDF